MNKIFLKIFWIIICILPVQILADVLPFEDIDPNGEYYEAVTKLYKEWIIYDDGSHKFNPEQTMNRDFFVGLATQIGCKECLNPTGDDLIKYNQSPFIDLKKENKFYYCISYAYEKNIVQWYNIDPYTNSVSCENWEKFSSSPFCSDNSTTRIEAAAMLLRQAKLWNDTLNSSNFEKNEDITDIPKNNYWYWYAQKAIEIWIINKKSDSSIWINDKITRWEFIKMSALVLDYAQCEYTYKKKNSYNSYIEIFDKDDKITNKTTFYEWDIFSFIPVWDVNNKTYDWTATSNWWNIVKWNNKKFEWSQLKPWKWNISLKIEDQEL